ncbi:MAG: lipopolysaccharide heptosyltransferase II, partial [Desulfobaccales bacterium]
MALAALYQVGARGRRRLYQSGWLTSQHLPAPVVSVGNLAVGGTGKSPVTAHLARLFQEQGRRVAILSRGYGGRRPGVTCLSDGERLFYQPPAVGEEAFDMAQALPGALVYTGPCRYEAGLAAWRDHRPDIFLLDDGFQHFQLARDLELVLLDAHRPFGNGRLLPAGPLREPLDTVREADALILTRYDQTRHRDRLSFLRNLFPRQEIFTATIDPVAARRFPEQEKHPPEILCGITAVAFAGLARPRVFQDALIALGVNLRGFRAFPDHYAFTPDDLLEISRQARSAGAQALITTSKDCARFGQLWQGDIPLWVLEVAARVEPGDAFREWLNTALGETGGSCHLPSSIKPIKTVGWASMPAVPLEFSRLNLEKASSGADLRSLAPIPLHPIPPQVRRRFQHLTLKGKPPPGAPNVRQILLRAPNWLGDAVMGLPVLSGLAKKFPAAQITILAVPRVAPLFAGQPGVAEVMPYPAGHEKWGTLLGLRARFDLALALPNSLESALGLWLTGTPHRLGYAANGRSPFLTNALKGRNRLKGLHQVFYYLGILEALGPVTDFSPPRLQVSPEKSKAGKSLLIAGGLSPGHPWVGLAPGAAYGPAKRWPAERFAGVGDLLQREFQAGVVLLGGPTDQEAAAEVQRAVQGVCLNLAGQTTLRQALGVISNLQVLITNDSGLMHVAAALAVPVVAIFGSTDPAATRPFSRRAAVIQHHLPCSPCLERTCSVGYPCLTNITVDEVAAAARLWLEEKC